MGEHLEDGDPFAQYPSALLSADVPPFRGFLTGAIDLTARVGDRFVVMDYKSNAMPVLGELPGHDDYGAGALTGAMLDGNYVLQATLYQVALHRYLQWRLAGYDPERHLGGSTYLFLRGMTGPGTPVVEGARAGVVRWHPPASMIVALSELFVRGGT
jgi:exodeoxyribonuclease V beta subunit